MSDMGKFIQGLIVGGLLALLILGGLIYLFNMQGQVVISVAALPDVHSLLQWAFDNLRLSLIPFTLFFVLYLKDLFLLKKMIANDATSLVRVSQKEHLVDIWINVFFGVGVIWTAIGMRAALLSGLGDLNADTAASQGAFSILERLVGGGILLALSTTIFGGIGGYLMRVFKALYVGYSLTLFYSKKMDAESDAVLTTLRQMERHLDTLSCSHSEKNREERSI